MDIRAVEIFDINAVSETDDISNEYHPRIRNFEEQEPKKSGLKSSSVEISYNQLQQYGYCIISTKRFGEETYESKYVIKPINHRISEAEKKLLLRSKLVNKPSFIHIYMVKKNGSASNVAFMIVKDRFGKKSTVFYKTFNIKL